MVESIHPKADEPRPTLWRGYVTLLFADLCDYTGLGEQHDPEEIDELRFQLEQLAGKVIERHGGSVSQIYGDGILAVFGFPEARGDDSRRAVGAAVELSAAVRELRLDAVEGTEAVEFRLHSGVHAGLVCARSGDALNGKYSLSGDTVSTTARLCATAGRDEVVVSDAVRQGIDGFFSVAQLQAALMLKGKRAPVVAYRVLGPSDVTSHFQARCRRGLSAFVGRERELSQLQACAETESGCRVIVRAAAGVGKSRLLEEFRHRISSHERWALHGYCESYGDVVPLQPFLHMLRQLIHARDLNTADHELHALGVRPEDAAVLLALLALRPAAQEEVNETTIERAFTGLFTALASVRSVLVTVDDWQWADDMSRKLLAALLDERTCPMSVVLAVRATDRDAAPPSEFSVLDLLPFDEVESASVARSLRTQNLPAAVVKALHRRSGGNALFLEELCRALPSEAFCDEAALEMSGAPTTLHGVIQARLTGLDPRDAQVLQAAAVIGNELASSLLAELLSDSDINASLEALTAADIIYPGDRPGQFRFKHGIAREVVYESVRIAERRAMHAAIVQHLLQKAAGADSLDDRVEALAYHCHQSGDFERAVRFGEAAGDKALATSALDRARQQYVTALNALELLSPCLEHKRRFLAIAARWGQACVYSPSRDQLALLERAVAYAQELGDQRGHAEVQNLLGWIHYVLGDYPTAEAHYSLARELAERLGDLGRRLLVQLDANFGQCYAAAGSYDEALRLLSNSILNKQVRSRRGPSHVAQGSAYALSCRAVIHGDRGDFGPADHDLRLARELCEDTGHAVEGSVFALSAMLELQRGAWEACRSAALRSHSIAERDSHYTFTTSAAYESYARFMLTRDPDALRQLRNSVESLEGRGTTLFLSFAQGCLAHAAWFASDLPLAQYWAERALVRARQHDPLGEAAAHRVLARVCSTRSTPSRIELASHLQSALAAAERRRSPRETLLTHLLAAQLGAPNVQLSAEQALVELQHLGVRADALEARATPSRPAADVL